MSIEVIGDKELLRRIEALRSAGQNRKMMGTLGGAVAERAKIKVPRKTGNLGRSIEVTQVTDDRVQIAARANYAAAVELGSKAHRIDVRRRKALRWAAGAGGARLSGSPRRGAAVNFAKYVNHPGSKGQPYLRPAAEEVLRSSRIVPKSIETRWNGAA